MRSTLDAAPPPPPRLGRVDVNAPCCSARCFPLADPAQSMARRFGALATGKDELYPGIPHTGA